MMYLIDTSGNQHILQMVKSMQATFFSSVKTLLTPKGCE